MNRAEKRGQVLFRRIGVNAIFQEYGETHYLGRIGVKPTRYAVGEILSGQMRNE